MNNGLKLVLVGVVGRSPEIDSRDDFKFGRGELSEAPDVHFASARFCDRYLIKTFRETDKEKTWVTQAF